MLQVSYKFKRRAGTSLFRLLFVFLLGVDMGETQETAIQKSELVEVAVRRNNGSYSTELKDKRGRFAAKKEKLLEPKEIKKAFVKLMMQAEAGSDGKMVKGAKTRWRKVFEAIVKRASYDGEDAKLAMAQIQAAKLIVPYIMNMPSRAPEEIEAMKDSLSGANIKVLIVPPPELINNEIISEEQKSLPNKPSFIETIDAEIVKEGE